MPAGRCTHCSEEIPTAAKFCPRCGKPAPAGETARHSSVDLQKMSAPIPLAGIIFLLVLVLCPAAIVAGVILGSKLLVGFGIVLGLALILLLVLGSLS